MYACPAGLDAVMVLKLDDEALAVKRAMGRRVDPLTGRVYHLEFDAPPPKEPGLAARLKVTPFTLGPLQALVLLLYPVSWGTDGRLKSGNILQST